MFESTWDAVISKPDDLAADAYVCFTHLPETGSERVVIASESDWHPDDDGVPTPAAQAGMTDCMTQGDVVQIVANAMAQDRGVPRRCYGRQFATTSTTTRS